MARRHSSSLQAAVPCLAGLWLSVLFCAHCSHSWSRARRARKLQGADWRVQEDDFL